MLCYEMTLSYEKFEEKESDSGSRRDNREKDLQKLNTRLLNLSEENVYQVFAFEYDAYIRLAILLQLCAFPRKEQIQETIREIVIMELNLKNAKIIELKETTVAEFSDFMEMTEDRSYMDRRVYKAHKQVKTDIYHNRTFKAREEIVASASLTKAQALKEAKSLMADQSLLDEIERIYDKSNKEQFYGFPVHYCVTTQGADAAWPIVHLLVRALHHKKRLPGSRICIFTDISSGCYDEDDFVKICRQSAGSSVVIELKGNYGNHGIFASGYERVISFILKVVGECHNDTQFFFIQNVDYEGFSKNLLSRIKDEVEIVELHEGVGGKAEAASYLMRLIQESPMKELASSKDVSYLPQMKKYRAHVIHEAFDKWRKDCLKQRAYPAYRDQKTQVYKEKKVKKEKYYQELQEMTGLTDVKKLCDEIICAYKMQKIREGFGLNEQEISRHMVFTGNPGSAKTTVARLLCGILEDEGVLASGKLVECGRGDLVGRYVGWTAKTVQEKFKEARGGILFIDEAYALVDDSRSFGDEAINTIVQEMENHRDSVIVIFAGYPERMKEFLDRNEGLRSRIAFHLNFPDYNEAELMDILGNMIRRKGFTVNEEALMTCRSIFDKACGIKDFGNGRFVRNYLDQAILRQSLRVVGNGGIKEMRKVTKEQATTLTADDFMVDMELLFKNDEGQKPRLGFAAY